RVTTPSRRPCGDRLRAHAEQPVRRDDLGLHPLTFTTKVFGLAAIYTERWRGPTARRCGSRHDRGPAWPRGRCGHLRRIGTYAGLAPDTAEKKRVILEGRTPFVQRQNIARVVLFRRNTRSFLIASGARPA